MMNNKNTISDEADIIVKHQYYKPQSQKVKKFKRLKNIMLFGFYIAAVAIIVNFANGNKITKAFAGNIESISITSEKFKSKLNYDALSMEDKLRVKFFGHYMHSEVAAASLFYECQTQDVDMYTMLALIKTESSFNPKAVNYNKNGSIDRGLCQLNNFVFKDLTTQDFFNIETNIHYGVKHFKWCCDQSKSNLVKALAMYNAGYGSVTNTKVGEKTLNYIQNILDTVTSIKQEELSFIAEYQDLLR